MLKKNNSITLVVIFLFVFLVKNIFFVHTVLSQEIELSVSDSLDKALSTNLDIRLQKSTLDALSWENAWKWTSIIPNVTGTGSLSRSNIKPSESSLSSQWGLNGSISVSSPLGPLLVKKIINVVGANLNFQKGEISYEKAISTVLIVVQKAYYDLLISKKELVILEKQLKVNEEKNSDFKLSYESGLLEEYTFLQSQIQQLELEQKIHAKKNAIVTLSNNLAEIIGEKEGTQFTLVDEIPEIDETSVQDIFVKTNLDNNHDIRKAHIDEVILNVAQYASVLGLLPTLNLSWQNSRTFLDDPLAQNWFNNDKWSKDSGSLSLSLSFNISDLFPGSQAFLAYITARKNYKNNVLNTQKTVHSLLLNLVKSQNALQLSLTSLEIAKKQRHLSRAAFRIMQEKYDNGLARFTEYLTAENHLLDTEKNYLSQTVTIIKSTLDIQLLLGEYNAQ